MATLAVSDVYGYLRQAGFNHNEAVILTAVAGGESGWNPRAHNPKPPDNSYGLFQINMLGAMGPERRKAFGISKNEDLFDPATNAKAAYMIYKWQGFRAWSVYSSGAYKQYLGKAEQAAKYFEQHGFSEGQGGSGVGYQASSSGPGGGGAMTTMSPTGAGSAPSQVEAINIPTDASWIQVGGKLYVAYRIQGEGGASSVVYWEVDDPSVKPPAGKTPGQVSSSQFKKWQAEWIDGGSVEAFRGFKKGGTFQESLDKMLFEMGIAGTEALKDAEVLQVIALYIARPDMSEREFANRLRGTQYFQSKTDRQREWNDLSKAERDLRTQDAAMDLVGLWFTYVGEDIDITRFDTNRDGTVSLDELKKGNPELASYAEKVASGQLSQDQVINQWLKPEARKNPDSPWSRQLRSEEQQQGQFEVDVENQAQQIMELYREWGMPLSQKSAMKMAEDVVMNRKSVGEIQMELDVAASAMYPHKPKGVSTRQWARPYMELYAGTLETAEPDLMDKTLQKALQGGMSLGDFRISLKHDSRWAGTLNARDEVAETMSRLGEKMGYV